MTVPVTNDQLIGDFLPKVFVTRIILTESGGSTTTRGDNPHIDIRIPSNIPKLDKDGNLTEKEKDYAWTMAKLEQSFRGLAEDEKTTLSTYGMSSNQENLPLSARIDLNFKDSIENNLLGTWFNNEDLKKMVKVKVIACCTSIASEQIQATILKIKSGEDNISTLDSAIQSSQSIISQSFTLAEGGGAWQGNIITQSNYDTESEQTTYDIRSSLQFKLNKPNINHLTFFVVPYVDREILQNSFNPPLQLDSVDSSLFFGDCRVEPVIQNGDTVSTGTVYYDSSGNLYLGYVNWMGNDEIPNSPLFPYAATTGALLESRDITNTVIQDFRQQNLTKKIHVDFSDAKKNLNVSGFTKKQFFNDKLDNSNLFYTPVMSTRSPKGDVKLCFGINLEWFLRTNSPYGKLWDNMTPDQKDNLFNSKLFKDVSLIRRRVKGIDDERLLDANTPITVVTTADSLNSLAESQQSNVNKSSILTRISIDHFIKDKSNKKFVYFSARDADINNQGPGYYQYGLRYTFDDSILKTVQNLTLALQQDFKVYRQLVYTSRNPKYYDVYTNSFNKAFGSEAANWLGVVPVMLANFVLLRNILTGDHMNGGIINSQTALIMINLLNITSPKTGSPQGMEFLLNLVDELLSLTTELFEIKSIANTSQGFRTPSPSSPQKHVKSITREVYFSSAMGGIVDTTMDKNLGYDFLWKTDSEGFLKNTGIGGNIKVNRTSPQGLSSFSYDYFTERTKQETEKYFTSDQLELNLMLPKLENKKIQTDLESQRYTFLSPSLVQTPQLGFIPVLSNGSNKIEYDRLNTLYTEIIKRRLNDLDSGFKVDKKELKFLSQNDKEQKYQLEQIISLKGGTVVSTDRGGAELFGLLNPPTEEGQNISFNNLGSPLGPSQTEIQEQSNFETLGSGVPPVDESSSDLLQETNYNDALLGLTIVDAHGGMNELNKFTNRINGGGRNKNEIPYVTLEDLVPLPNQLKQLVILNSNTNIGSIQNNLNFQTNTLTMADIDEGATRLDTADARKLEKQFGIWMNYFNLVKVQVFTGFQWSQAGGTDYVMQNVFVDMTPEHFTMIKNSNMRVVCRLTPYVNELLDITTDNTLSLPIFDQYFIIESGPSTAVKTAAQNLASMTRLLNTMSSHIDALETPPDYVNTGGFYGGGIGGNKPDHAYTSIPDGFTAPGPDSTSKKLGYNTSPGNPGLNKRGKTFKNFPDSELKPKWGSY